MATQTNLETIVFDISQFDRASDNAPKPLRATWRQLCAGLSRHREQDAKDGRLWSPASFFPNATRASANVDKVSLLVMDCDDGEPVEEIRARLQGLAHVVYSTYSYTPVNVKCRVVVPLVRPVAGSDWERVWRKCLDRFEGLMDPACKDAARMYYLPSCPPGAERVAVVGEGDPLDERDIPDLPPAPARRTNAKGQADGAGRVGDDFNQRATWAQVLEPAGWELARIARGGREFWKRPGTKSPHSAATFADDGSLMVYSTASALPSGRHDKFGAFARLHADGDFAVATRKLAEQGYGDQMPSLSSPSIAAADIPGRAADPPAQVEAVEYNRTDLGNAERLADRIRSEMRYVHQWRQWLLWDGKRWVPDETQGDAALARAAQTVRAMYAEASDMDDGPERKALAKWALACESKTRIASMASLVTAQKGIGVSPADLDRDGWLLNCANGTIDMRSGAIREHRCEDLLTKLSPASYHGPAEAERIPTWLRFFFRVLPAERVQDFVFRYLGSCLVADNQDQCLAFFHGLGANGKTTMIETVGHVMGDYACGAPPEMLTVGKLDGSGPSPELARLKGARLVTVPETEDGKRLAESLVKRLTGGEKIYARAMYRDPFEFEFLAKILMSGNHRPAIRGDDLGIWRRIKLVPFLETIPEIERDPMLRDKLRIEADGILSWLVAGCLEWQAQGLGSAEEIEAATQDYRSEMDVLGAFVSEWCDVRADAEAGAGELYRAYKAWTENGGEYTMTQTKFGRKMSERGFVKEQHPGGVRVYRGLALKGEEARDAWWTR